MANCSFSFIEDNSVLTVNAFHLHLVAKNSSVRVLIFMISVNWGWIFVHFIKDLTFTEIQGFFENFNAGSKSIVSSIKSPIVILELRLYSTGLKYNLSVIPHKVEQPVLFWTLALVRGIIGFLIWTRLALHIWVDLIWCVVRFLRQLL